MPVLFGFVGLWGREVVAFGGILTRFFPLMIGMGRSSTPNASSANDMYTESFGWGGSNGETSATRARGYLHRRIPSFV